MCHWFGLMWQLIWYLVLTCMCCLLLFCWPFNGNNTKLKRSLICSNYFSFLEFSNNITCKKHRCHSSLLLVLVFSGLHLGVNGLWLKVNTEWPVLRTSPQKWRLFFFFSSPGGWLFVVFGRPGTVLCYRCLPPPWRWFHPLWWVPLLCFTLHVYLLCTAIWVWNRTWKNNGNFKTGLRRIWLKEKKIYKRLKINMVKYLGKKSFFPSWGSLSSSLKTTRLLKTVN